MQDMDSRIAALVAEQAGAFSAAEAVARGVDPLVLRAAVRERQVVAVRRDAYVSRALLAAPDADARFRLTAMAVARTRPGDVGPNRRTSATARCVAGHDGGTRRAIDVGGMSPSAPTLGA